MRRVLFVTVAIALLALGVTAAFAAPANPINVGLVTGTLNESGVTVKWDWKAWSSGLTGYGFRLYTRQYDLDNTTYTQLSTVALGALAPFDSTIPQFRTEVTTAAANTGYTWGIDVGDATGRSTAIYIPSVRYTLQNKPIGISISDLTTTGFTATADGLVNPTAAIGTTTSGVQFKIYDGATQTDGTKQNLVDNQAFSGLAANTQYQLNVRAYNAEGKATAWYATDLDYANYVSVYTAALTPDFSLTGDTADDITADKAAGLLYNVGESFTFAANFGIDGAGSSYTYFWGSAVDGSTVWADWTAGDLVLTGDAVGDYYLFVKALNGDGVATEFSQSGLYQVQAVPEPGTLLATLGLLGPAVMAFRRRRS